MVESIELTSHVTMKIDDLKSYTTTKLSNLQSFSTQIIAMSSVFTRQMLFKSFLHRLVQLTSKIEPIEEEV